MVDRTVRSLLDAVRRRLWRERARRAVRHAAWLSAATVLLVGALHLAWLSVPAEAMLAIVGVEWLALLAALAWRRPSDGACALWIDRHLGGASAFTTLLDPTLQSQASAHAHARRWLERWAAARVPAVLRSLAERRSAARVSRSLLSMTVCSALVLFVLTLPDTAPTLRREASAPARASAADTPTAGVKTVAAADLASEIASALRSPATPNESQRQRGGDAPAAGATRTEDGSGSPAPAPRATLSSADASSSRDSSSPAALDARASAAPGRSADSVSGRDAGDSPDLRADAGVSRAPAGTIAAVRSGSTVRLAEGERRADMEQAAGFEESDVTSAPATSGAVLAVAAATPPAAVAGARLSTAEASYVQAWMKATGRSR